MIFGIERGLKAAGAGEVDTVEEEDETQFNVNGLFELGIMSG